MRFFLQLLCSLLLLFSLHHLSENKFSYAQVPIDPYAFPQDEDSLNIEDSLSIEMKSDWEETALEVHRYKKNSNINHPFDTTLNHTHEVNIDEAFGWANIGNYRSTGYYLKYQLEDFEGKRGRNHLYNPYLFKLKNQYFYDLNQPYTNFSFHSIGQNQQHVSLLHAQNIKPNWNFSFEFMGNGSDGDYSFQKTQQFSGILKSHYTSPKQRYNSYLSLLFNSNKQYENGGIQSLDYLSNPAFKDRKRIPTIIGEGSNRQGPISPISHRHRDFHLEWSNSYSIGVVDTLYNIDSTSYKLTYTPRLIGEHTIHWRYYNYFYEDKQPENFFYDKMADLGNLSFNDTIFAKRDWQTIDNQFSLTGNFGKGDRQFQFKAGVGLKNQIYKQVNDIPQKELKSSWGTYVFGLIRKEAKEANQWDIYADGQLFFSGAEIGNFNAYGRVAKAIKDWAALSIHGSTRLQSPRWDQEFRMFSRFNLENPDLQNESISNLGAALSIPKIKLTAFTEQYLLNNWISLKEDWQYKNNSTLYINQIGLKHDLKVKAFFLKSEAVYQALSSKEDIDLPEILIKEYIGAEFLMFKKALLVQTGLQAIWYSPFTQSQYVPLLNDFYYNGTSKTSYMPILHYNLNFKVKSFRAFVSVQHLQQLWSQNIIFSELHPYRNTYFLFGFNWQLLK